MNNKDFIRQELDKLRSQAGGHSFLYEKNELTEFAPRPTPVTYDLFRLIYSPSGPISRVYQKYKINYRATDFLKIIGNELFVDREAELNTLFPSYSYFSGESVLDQPKFKRIKYWWPTLKNTINFQRLKAPTVLDLFQLIQKRILTTVPVNDFAGALKVFLTDYQFVFEINLIAGFKMNQLKVLLKNSNANVVDVIASPKTFISWDENLNLNLPDYHWLGNSLELSDLTPFFYNQFDPLSENETAKNWWLNLSQFSQKIFSASAESAILFNYLRECGRVLTVKNINLMRKFLIDRAQQNGFEDTKFIFFSSIQDVLDNKIDLSSCRESQTQYLKYNDFALPKRLTDKNISSSEPTQGISAGVASGRLVDLSDINLTTDSKENKILYTKELSPNLVNSFNKIKGIVSQSGGVLSHLAILAREKKLPIVVNFSLGDQGINLNDSIKIDGSSGDINKIGF